MTNSRSGFPPDSPREDVDDTLREIDHLLERWDNRFIMSEERLVKRWMDMDLEIILEGKTGPDADPICAILRSVRDPHLDDMISTGEINPVDAHVGEKDDAVLVGIVQFGQYPEQVSSPALVWLEKLEYAKRRRADSLYVAFYLSQELPAVPVDREADLANRGPSIRINPTTFARYGDGEVLEGGTEVMDRITDSEAELIRDVTGRCLSDHLNVATLRVHVARVGESAWLAGCESVPDVFHFKKMLLGPVNLCASTSEPPIGALELLHSTHWIRATS